MFRYFASILSDEKNFLTVSAVFLALGANLSILLDVPVLRQLFGFAFLTLLPGILLLRFFKMTEAGFLEEIILCWGLSVAFVMFYTLALNSVLPIIGYTAPLSSSTLLFCLDLALVPLGIVFYRAGSPIALQFPRVEVTKSNAYLYIIPLFFPLLSVIGSFVMRVTSSNLVSLALLVFIALYVAFVCLKDNCPNSLYPVLIFSAGLSILLLWSLRSDHLLGADLHAEYYLFQSILSDHRMILGSLQQPAYILYASVGSILLPVAYQLILGLNQEVLFNVIYGLLFSVVPLIVYVISRRYVKERYALIASFLYISEVGFMDANALSRAVIAILFFALAFMVLFSKQRRGAGEVMLFTVFAAAGIVSHYTTAYIFVLVFVAALVLIILSKRTSFATTINTVMVFLLACITFLWYGIITESSSITFGIELIRKSFSGLIFDFFAPQTRGGAQVYLGAGANQTTVAAMIGVALTWVVVACLIIGVATLTIKRKEMTTLYSGPEKPKFLKSRFGVEYFTLALAATGILIASVVLPFVATAYPLERTFLFLTTFLSVFFVIGVIVLSNGIAAFSETIHRRFKERKTSKLRASDSRQGRRTIRANWAIPFALIILVAYLFSTSGALSNIAGTPRSVTLDSHGAIFFERYVYDQDAVAAKWLKLYGGTTSVSTADTWGKLRLISEGHISPGLINDSSFQKNQTAGNYIYLYYYNVVEKKYEVYGEAPDIPGDMAEHLLVLSQNSRVFDAGGSQIYARQQYIR